MSAQDRDDVIATARQAQAAVQQARASLQTSNVNLEFTLVRAPISGRIGRTLFTPGALVTASQTDPLTTIQQLDPIYVDVTQSSAQLLALRRSLASGCTLSVPSTISRSPAFSPAVISHLSPIAWAAVTVRCSTLWALVTTSAVALPLGSRWS